MGRMRDAIALGDPTTSNGYVTTATSMMPVHSKMIATIGDSAYCDACKSTGLIMPLNNTATTAPNGRQIALEDDWVDCRCQEKPRLIASRRGVFQVEDDRAPMPRAPEKRVAPDATPVAMAVSPELELTDKNRSDICPGMDKANFCRNMLSLRDDAVVLIQRRLAALDRWDATEQARFKIWFGTTDDAARKQIQSGLTNMLGVMTSLTCANFVKYSKENLAQRGYGEHPAPNLAAAADVKGSTHTIFITERFCALRRYSANVDSQVMTLIHEVSHFVDVMDAKDFKYSMQASLTLALVNSSTALKNADNISGYLVA